MALLEARPYRPFKSSEEYLEAMKEDLAEWLSTLYPELLINAENFMDRLDTGVALCKHANYVRQAAEDYLARRQARNKSMTRSMTSGLAGPILAMGNVHYLPAAKSGTFFARDNVSNFITWCRKSLKIIECLLFETDDLIMRKNEKHVILCLLEVARRGAKFGMLAPMLVQMERQIDREIAAENKANGIGCGTQTDTNSSATQTHEIGVGTENAATDTGDIFDSDTDNEDDSDESPMLMYGPQPQIITNDLKSLDEMVRDLVEKCNCPSQFPMVRVSEGKYRIGDTKVLIFVRILRSHVMVRVGGGWDTLSHYLDKHDPCRCRAQHRTSVAARLIPRTNNQSNGGIELHKAQVIFERSPPSTRKLISTFNNQINQISNNSQHSSAAASPISSSQTTPTHTVVSNNRLSPSYSSHQNSTNNVKNRSRSPTPQMKYINQNNYNNNSNSNNNGTATIEQTNGNLVRRSVSPSPRRLVDIRKKQTSLDGNGPKSLPAMMPIVDHAVGNHVQFDNLNLLQTEGNGVVNGASNGNNVTNGTSDTNSSGNKFENISDNGSEISDEGYRSLGVIQSNAQKRESLHSQASTEDAENNARLDQNSSDSQLSPVEVQPTLTSKPAIEETTGTEDFTDAHEIAMGPQSLPAVLTVETPPSSPTPTPITPITTPVEEVSSNKFERSGVFITDDEITVDIANSTGLRKTNFSTKMFNDKAAVTTTEKESKIPRSPLPKRRSSVDSCGSLQDLSTRTGLPVFNRTKPVYTSVRKPPTTMQKDVTRKTKEKSPAVKDVTNTWSGRAAVNGRKRPTINANTFTPQLSTTPTTSKNNTTSSAFDRNNKTRSSQILYDSNGRRVRCGVTASLNTSPVKNQQSSPLAQQLLEAANSAKNDAQILEKMKTLLSRYASGNQSTNTAMNTGTKTNAKKPVYEDFTSAWVHSNGNLERSSSCSPPTKTLSKRSSAASSTESTHSRDMSVIISPRRDRGLSKIPAPVRQNTELY